MTRLSEELERQFFDGDRSAAVPFVINDPVAVVSGPHSGKTGSVISIADLSANLLLLVELADGTGDVVVDAHCLRHMGDKG